MTIDNVAPTPVIASTETGPTNANPIPVSITFDEDMDLSTIALTDFTVGNGTASNLNCTGSPTVCTIDVTPTADGNVTVDLAANLTDDLAGNGNTAATQFSIISDSNAPTPVIASTETGPTNANPIPVSITFDEDMDLSTIALTDFTVGNGTASNLNCTGSPTVCTIDVTPTADGNVTMDLAANLSDDLAGNGNNAAAQFSILSDTTAPVGPITASTSPASPTSDPNADLNIDCGLDAANGTVVVTTNPANGFTPNYGTTETLDANGQLVLNAITWSPGTYDILLACNDEAGNGPSSPTTPPSVTITVGATPTVAFSSPAAASTVANILTTTGTCSEVAENVSISAVAPAVLPGQPLTASCTASGTWVLSGVDISGIADGAFSITADHCASGGTPCATQDLLNLNKSSSSPTCDILYAGGTGTSVDPYQIVDVYGLQCITDDLDAHYVLSNDIDSTATNTWTKSWWINSAPSIFPFAGDVDPCNYGSPPYETVGTTGDGFLPIGSLSSDGSGGSNCSLSSTNYVDPFIGELDGANHTIDGLFIDRENELNIALFGGVEDGVVVKDLNLDNFNINANYTMIDTTTSYGSARCRMHYPQSIYIGGLVACGDFMSLSSAHTFIENVKWLGGNISYTDAVNSQTRGEFFGHIAGSITSGNSFAHMSNIEVHDTTHVTGAFNSSNSNTINKGALIGYIQGALVDDILVNNTVMSFEPFDGKNTNSQDQRLSGFVGWASSSHFSNIDFTGKTICHTDSASAYFNFCGGLFGEFNGGSLRNSSIDVEFRPTSKASGSSAYYLDSGGVVALLNGGANISNLNAKVHMTDDFDMVKGDNSTYYFESNFGGLIGRVNASSSNTSLIERVGLDLSIDFATHGSSSYDIGGFIGGVQSTSNSDLTINDSSVLIDLQSASSSMVLKSFAGFVGFHATSTNFFTVNNSFVASVGNEIHVNDQGGSGYPGFYISHTNGFSYGGVINDSFADVSILDLSGTPLTNAFCESCTPTNVWFFSDNQGISTSYGVQSGNTTGHPQIFEASASSDFYDIDNAPMTSWDFTASGPWDPANDDINYPTLK